MVGVPIEIVSLGWIFSELFKIAGAKFAEKLTKLKTSIKFSMSVIITFLWMAVILLKVNIFTIWVFVLNGLVCGLVTGSLITPLQESVEEEKQATANSALFGRDDSKEGNGWVRYYMIVVTGDEAISARLALFNGGIDATKTTGLRSQGEVYFDNADFFSIGTYALEASEDESATLKEVTTTPATGFDALKDAKVEEGISFEGDNIVVSQPTTDEWKEIRKLDEVESHEDEKKEDEKTPETKSEVNVVLLISAISSILLVAALLIVVVIKVFKKRK